MADRPIIFSGPMVRALLAGRKTQTRRLAKFVEPVGEQFHVRGNGGGWYGPEARVSEVAPDYARYAVGDRLYVREAWAPLSACMHNDPGTQALADNGFYRADRGTIDGEIDRWRPSVHMPRSASRLTLIVEVVRVERLQAISEEDAIAEGIELHRLMGASGWTDYGDKPGDMTRRYFADPRRSFQSLWQSLHGADAWDANPFVVGLTFRIGLGNIDRIAA